MDRNSEDEDMINFALAYCRKSDEDKKQQVLSLDDQVNECNKLIDTKDLILIEPHFKEEKSAKMAGKRIEFYRMLGFLKKGKAKVVVCWAANRLARNIKDGAEIIDLVQNKGLRIITPYTQYDLTNWFMLLIEFGMSTDFSLKLSTDVKRGLASKVAKGIKPGIAALGYRNVGEIKGEKDIVPDRKRFDLCKNWWDLILTGQYTVEQSLEKITAIGLRDRRGNKVSKTTAFRFFHNLFYAGYFEYSGKIHPGKHKPMISMDDFNKAQKIITGKFGGRYEQYGEMRPLALSGFIKCGECGATISSETKVKHYKNGTSQEFRYYRCKKNKGVCTQKSYIQAERLEEQVRTYINNLELDPEFIAWVRVILRRRNKDEFEFDRKQKEILAKRLQDISQQKEKVYDMKLAGLYSEEEFKEKVKEVLKDEIDVKEILNSDRISYWGRVIDDTLEFATKVLRLFNLKDNPYIKRSVLQILGADLKLRDKKLYLEAKSAFIFLKDKQREFYQENGSVGPKIRLPEQTNLYNSANAFSSGAEDGNRTRDPVLTKNVLYH